MIILTVALVIVTLAILLVRPRKSPLILGWMLIWIACVTWMVAPVSAQAGAPNGKQFNLTITNAAVVQLTVPAGTTYCVIGVKTNPINYDVGTTSSNAAPTTTTGIQASAGAVISLTSFVLCRNFGAIAQSANAQLDIVYFR